MTTGGKAGHLFRRHQHPRPPRDKLPKGIHGSREGRQDPGKSRKPVKWKGHQGFTECGPWVSK